MATDLMAQVLKQDVESLTSVGCTPNLSKHKPFQQPYAQSLTTAPLDILWVSRLTPGANSFQLQERSSRIEIDVVGA